MYLLSCSMVEIKVNPYHAQKMLRLILASIMFWEQLVGARIGEITKERSDKLEENSNHYILISRKERLSDQLSYFKLIFSIV